MMDWKALGKAVLTVFGMLGVVFGVIVCAIHAPEYLVAFGVAVFIVAYVAVFYEVYK